jgi:hypothetical protein
MWSVLGISPPFLNFVLVLFSFFRFLNYGFQISLPWCGA